MKRRAQPPVRVPASGRAWAGRAWPPANPAGPGIDDVPDNQLPGRFFGANGVSYDWVARLGTLGMDDWWKHLMLRRLAPIGPRPARLLDQACGTGILTLRLARRFPGCRVVGVDRTEPYLRIARRKAAALSDSGRVAFVLGSAEEVRLKEAFDAVTSSYLAKYARLPELIANTAAMLRRGGILVMHDFTCPPDPRMARLWGLHFKVLQRAAAPFFPEWRQVFHELPVLLRRTAWVGQTRSLLASAGFRQIAVDYCTFGSSAIVSARKA